MSNSGTDMATFKSFFINNNIVPERCDLYGDFIISLFLLIFDTYLGDDITNKADQRKHFKWCWNKNVKNFKVEGFYIHSSDLYDYFQEFVMSTYYTSLNKSDKKQLNDITGLWKFLFDCNKPKSKVDTELLIDVYNKFESSKINY